PLSTSPPFALTQPVGPCSTPQQMNSDCGAEIAPIAIWRRRMSFWRPSPTPPRPVDLLYNSPDPGPWSRSFSLQVGIGLLRRPAPVDPGLESLEDHMSHQGQPVIVGAGPVGLGAALFLARQGQVARVVEMRDEPSQHSRALAVNPRTLDILEPTGVTSRMLERGSRIHGVRFHRGGRIIAQLPFAGMHPR